MKSRVGELSESPESAFGVVGLGMQRRAVEKLCADDSSAALQYAGCC